MMELTEQDALYQILNRFALNSDGRRETLGATVRLTLDGCARTLELFVGPMAAAGTGDPSSPLLNAVIWQRKDSSVRSSALLPPERRYAPVAIFLHWALAALIFGTWFLPHLRGVFPGARLPIMDLHRSIGMTIFTLVLLRVVWRSFNPPPGLPGGTPQVMRWMAYTGHAALYLLMVAVPICGMLLTWAAGHSIPVFGLFTVPSPIASSQGLHQTFQDLHGLLANALIWLAAAHAVAGLVHHYVFKDGLLERMLPERWRRARSPGALI
jgi:cytochrome b561